MRQKTAVAFGGYRMSGYVGSVCQALILDLPQDNFAASRSPKWDVECDGDVSMVLAMKDARSVYVLCGD